MTNSTDYPNPATIQIRSSSAGERPRDIQCQMDSHSGQRLAIISNERVSVSTPVSVEYNDAMLLCEVVACTQDCQQRWHLELKIEQILTGLQSLVRLRQRLLGESVPVRADAAAVGAQGRY